VPDFALDPRLAGDTVPVTDLALCRVLLARDANYPWLIMVPQRAGLVEIVDLGEADRIALMQEIAAVSEALRASVPCDKLNVAALGNSVPQLHVHVIARQHDDAAWPGPIWGVAEARPYASGEAETLAARLAERLTPPR
jgi:diadenosine tetraphosphate (Ap4A) HIT family hydrolase